MKRTLLSISVAMMLLASCGSGSRQAEIDAIEQCEQRLSMVDINSSDSEVTDLVSHYRNFASRFPDDSLAPVYLTRAADLCINTGQFDLALSLLDSVMVFSGYEDLGGAAFLKGYAYEMSQRYDEAREAYTNFVEQYPDHYLAPDVEKILPYIGLSPEELFDLLMNEMKSEEAADKADAAQKPAASKKKNQSK